MAGLSAPNTRDTRRERWAGNEAVARLLVVARWDAVTLYRAKLSDDTVTLKRQQDGAYSSAMIAPLTPNIGAASDWSFPAVAL